MITAGLRLTLGGSIAVIRDDVLLFAAATQLGPEEESTGPRNLARLLQSLAAHDIDTDDIDEWAIDSRDGLTTTGGVFEVGGVARPYGSYEPLDSCVAAAYCTSPFASRGEAAAVLVWDSEFCPRLYTVTAAGRIQPGENLFALPGHGYAMAAWQFGVLAKGADEKGPIDRLSAGQGLQPLISGERGARITSEVHALLVRHFCDDAGAEQSSQRPRIAGFLDEMRHRMALLDADDVTVAAALRAATGRLLLERVVELGSRLDDGAFNLCFTGSQAVEVAWNTAIRDDPAVAELWMPPLSGDCGSAVGMAALHAGRDGLRALDWSPAVGPELSRNPHLPVGWSASPCRPEELARFLHRSGKPVTVIHGRVNSGPSALGTHSILAPATSSQARDLMNDATGRELNSPVDALCLLDDAAKVFDPGTEDRFLRFAHRIRPEWVDRLPAIRHADDGARVQTVCHRQAPMLTTLLREYRKWSGVPLLCHTNAVPAGAAPFASAFSALAGDRIDTVWSESVLYRRIQDTC